MENLIKGIGNLGNKKFIVKIYEIDEYLYSEQELTYFQLGTFLLTQNFIKVEIRKVD